MATTAVAIGKVELQRRKNLPIPAGWALDKDGNVTTDANDGFNAGMLLPLGGLEITSGYKGSSNHIDRIASTYLMNSLHFCLRCFVLFWFWFCLLLLKQTGYGLCAMVETLTGILSGAHYATNVRKWVLDGSNTEEADLGQVFIAVDPSCFAPGFQDRMTDLNGILRNLPPVKSSTENHNIHGIFKLCRVFDMFRIFADERRTASVGAGRS